MAEVMHNILFKAIRVTFVAIFFIAISANEVIIIDNTQCLSIHLYMVQQWKRIPILFYMETVSMFSISNNIFVFMLKCLLEFGGLSVEELC